MWDGGKLYPTQIHNSSQRIGLSRICAFDWAYSVLGVRMQAVKTFFLTSGHSREYINTTEEVGSRGWSSGHKKIDKC